MYSDKNISLDTKHIHFTDLLKKDLKVVDQLIKTHINSSKLLIPEIANYLISAGGKRLRPALTILSSHFFGAIDARIYPLAAAIEFIHSATLLHDDVIDHSDQRRGKTSAHIKWGNQASVLVGDFLFSRAFELMVEAGSLKALALLSKTATIISEGEIHQLSVMGDINITPAIYFDIIYSKTAALFSAALQMGPILHEKSEKDIENFQKLGFYIGMIFQIIDDILDYNIKNTKMNKNIGDDFKEGKITLPLIHIIDKSDNKEKETLKNIFENKDYSSDHFTYILGLIDKYDVFDDCLKYAHDYAEKAYAILNLYPASLYHQALYTIIHQSLMRQY